MKVSIPGIIINVIMLLVIIALIIAGLVYNNDLQTCETKQSPYCYTVQCPCDDQSTGPCFGYSKMSVGPGRWICSNATLTVVDDNGEPQ